MKRILVTIFLLVISLVYTVAQNYDLYLKKAFEHLEKGNKENAERSYRVYQSMTGKSNSDFEARLENFEIDDWKKDCYIIAFNDSISLAVQKIDPNQSKVIYSTAKKIAKASRVGNFFDWRLPYIEELQIIIPNIPKDALVYEHYHPIKDRAYKDKVRVVIGTRKIEKRTWGKLISSLTDSLSYSNIYYVIDKNNNEIEVYSKYVYKSGYIQEKGDKEFMANFLIVREIKNKE